MNIKPTTANDARAWSRGEPFTLFNERDGNNVCPGIVKLPCGDLLVTCARDGDYPLPRTRMLRSSDSGATWREDDLHHDFLPAR